MDGLGEDEILGLFCCIRREDKFANVGLVAETGLDVLLFADSSFLSLKSET